MKIIFRYCIMVILAMVLNLKSSAQNVGIGTSSPEGEFHVSKENVLIGPTFIGSGLDDIIINFDATLELTTSAQYNIVVDNTGPIPNLIDVYLNDNLLFDNLSMAASGIILGSGVSIGFSSLSGHTYADSWVITVNPGILNQLIVKGDNVGIGTNNPTTTLDVDGDINFSGDLLKNGNIYDPELSVNDLIDAQSTNQNLYIGDSTGISIIGNQNLFLGVNAGKDQTAGSNNVYLGYGAGESKTSGSGNVYIGNETMGGTSENNRLRINNDDSSTPFLYGEFDNDFLALNRTYRISAQEAFGITRDVTSPGQYAGMYIEARGNSNAIPFYGFAIDGNALAWIEYDGGSNDVTVNNLGGNFKVQYNSASKPVAGSWLANSDSRLKKNIIEMNSDEMLDKVLSMQGVHYEWNDDKTKFQRPDGKQIGFIAQDLQTIWPEKVSEDNLGFLQTAYGDYDPVFVEAIKALAHKLDIQAKELEGLKNKLAEMEASLQTQNQN